MKTSDAFKLIVKIEGFVDIGAFTWKGFNTWPLIRQILWFELTASKPNIIKKNGTRKKFSDIKNIISSLYYSSKKEPISKNNKRLFISRPVYLQKLHFGKYFDRIVDPIIELLHENEIVTKYYVSKVPVENELVHNFSTMHQELSLNFLRLTYKQKEILTEIANISKIDALDIQRKYKRTLSSFIRWYLSAKKILLKQNKLEEIYITSWYFPDMMGICAAATELGIKTIDVQHGKQGRYQAMYSGWTGISDTSYALMPDEFSCWGQRSCDHILESSPDRKNHKPFIGGYPWINYYKKHVGLTSLQGSSSLFNILVTLQPPHFGNEERIPGFIIDMLLSGEMKEIHFIFRVHPNDVGAKKYCEQRLRLFNTNSFSIDLGNRPLYDAFMVSKGHITAFSSCCYEASVFNVPTLLFGGEAKDIYEEDIEHDVFTWTPGTMDDLCLWLRKIKLDTNTPSDYIRTNVKSV